MTRRDDCDFEWHKRTWLSFLGIDPWTLFVFLF